MISFLAHLVDVEPLMQAPQTIAAEDITEGIAMVAVDNINGDQFR